MVELGILSPTFKDFRIETLFTSITREKPLLKR